MVTFSGSENSCPQTWGYRRNFQKDQILFKREKQRNWIAELLSALCYWLNVGKANVFISTKETERIPWEGIAPRSQARRPYWAHSVQLIPLVATLGFSLRKRKKKKENIKLDVCNDQPGYSGHVALLNTAPHHPLPYCLLRALLFKSSPERRGTAPRERAAHSPVYKGLHRKHWLWWLWLLCSPLLQHFLCSRPL